MPGEQPTAHEPLELVHHHPGRIRLRADALIGTALGSVIVERVRQTVASLPGVRGVHHNPRTGSLLVEYSPGLVDANVIVARIAAAAGLGVPLSPREARRHRRGPARATLDIAREINALTYELTGWRSDLRFLAPVALAGAAAVSLVRNKPNSRLPKWDTLLWYSYNVFSALHDREINEAEIEAAALTTPDIDDQGSE